MQNISAVDQAAGAHYKQITMSIVWGMSQGAAEAFSYR